MRTCIYCRRDLPESAFNKEHVIPRAFGLFRDNLTLDSVCTNCNDVFGRSIDLGLARGSFEAYLRFEHGLKDPELVHELTRTRFVLRAAEPPAWRGVKVAFDFDAGGVVMGLPAQAGLLSRSKTEIEFLTVPELRQQRDRLNDLYDLSEPIEMVGLTDADIGAVRQELRNAGVAEGTEHQMPSRPVDFERGLTVEIETHFDLLHQRAIAKIALDYLASVRGADFALLPDFDSIREFIRYGEPLEAGAVIHHRAMRPAGPLGDEPGHLIELRQYSDGRLVCRLSLFNRVTYEVVLSQSVSGILRPLFVVDFFHFPSRTRHRMKDGRVLRPLRLRRRGS